MWINAQGALNAGDVTVVGQRVSPAAKVHEKAYGYGTPYDRLRAVDRHIDEVQRIRLAEQDGPMGARECKARFQAALPLIRGRILLSFCTRQQITWCFARPSLLCWGSITKG
jgi:hypothetical protein